MKISKILWIEEEADDILVEFNTYFMLSGYDLDVVLSSSDAEKKLVSQDYDLIILDIRIIPGEENKWMEMHINGEKRLGLVLLKTVIGKNDALKNKTVIFTNENYPDIQSDLTECGFPQNRFFRKRDIKYPEHLENHIKKIFNI